MLIHYNLRTTISTHHLSYINNKTKKYKIAFLHLLTLLLMVAAALSAATQKKGLPGKTIRTPPVPKSQEVTISGNVKQLSLMGAMADAFAFRYTDLVSGKDVIIPLKRDSSGNYSVKKPITAEAITGLLALNYSGKRLFSPCTGKKPHRTCRWLNPGFSK